MKYWLIQPRDPLIFRDGRPFTADPGARAATLSFPYPSTLAGAARTSSVPAPWPQRFSDEQVKALLEKSIRGPLLAAVDSSGNVTEWFVPAPADALLLKKKDDEKSAIQQWLRPLAPPSGAQTDLGENIPVIGARQPSKEKPHSKAPAFWHWSQFEAWLAKPEDGDQVVLKDLGLPGLAREYRTHVRITPDTQTADAGGLFQTSGLEFTWVPVDEDTEKRDFLKLQELALAIATDVEIGTSLGFLGGERRIAGWKVASQPPFSKCPDAIRAVILAQRHCRLVILTPAIFESGHFPKQFLTKYGLETIIKGAAVPRYQT
ncbi:MAG: type III-B CRISPR module-associated Cmr3 family protein, partial [Chloroflexota bacterium]